MSIALYRRYRPETFQEVIGQEHVTDPLMAALAGGRTTHAYLFSGPRGCGKTTSARILARCLNCAEYPTSTPCGKCPSCVELSRDGSGSLDVVEMDAASHGGVDDARELREQAGFAPVRDRYKIFIIDEAHMVSNQGFNALLKLVEEPPEHVKFIFATTEPEKVIGTIRSRTHHYPFRLVPPESLEEYLAMLCAEEGVTVGPGVLPLVVRAGTGSVRDTLSVLDQLIGGSADGTLDYARAIALLGYTDASLLDDAVGAISADDGATLFAVVDKVVKSGHEPRRFVEDLLQRLRDLVIISLAGESAKDVFVSVPADQYERMEVQARAMGAKRASMSADLVNEALTNMAGATAPRLQLELLCARLLVPASAAATAPVIAAPAAQAAAPVAAPKVAAPEPVVAKPMTPPAKAAMPPLPPMAADSGPATPAAAPMPPMPEAAESKPAAPGKDEAAEAKAPAKATEPKTAAEALAPAKGTRAKQDEAVKPEAPAKVAEAKKTAPAKAEAPAKAPKTTKTVKPEAKETPAAPGVAEPDSAPATSSAAPTSDLSMIRQRWPEVLAALADRWKASGTLLSKNGHLGNLEGGTLSIHFDSAGLAQAFKKGHQDNLRAVLRDVLGLDVQVEGRVGDSAPDGAPKADPRPAAGAAGRESAPARAPKVRQPKAEVPAESAEAKAENAAAEPPAESPAAEQETAAPETPAPESEVGAPEVVVSGDEPEAVSVGTPEPVVVTDEDSEAEPVAAVEPSDPQPDSSDDDQATPTESVESDAAGLAAESAPVASTPVPSAAPATAPAQATPASRPPAPEWLTEPDDEDDWDVAFPPSRGGSGPSSSTPAVAPASAPATPAPAPRSAPAPAVDSSDPESVQAAVDRLAPPLIPPTLAPPPMMRPGSGSAPTHRTTSAAAIKARVARKPLPTEPKDGLDEPVVVEKDPVYAKPAPDPVSTDPAGVLGPLLDGTAIIKGDDNISANVPGAIAAAQAAQDPGEVQGFFGLNMPDPEPAPVFASSPAVVEEAPTRRANEDGIKLLVNAFGATIIDTYQAKDAN